MHALDAAAHTTRLQEALCCRESSSPSSDNSRAVLCCAVVASQNEDAATSLLSKLTGKVGRESSQCVTSAAAAWGVSQHFSSQVFVCRTALSLSVYMCTG